MMATKIQDQYVTVGDGRLYLRRWRPEDQRSGTPLILLHDALGSIAQWRDFPDQLAGRFGREVIAYERRGHGASSPLSGPRDAGYLHREAWEDLPALLSALAVEPPLLIGHSDGGTIALLYAAHFEAAAVVALAAHVLVEEVTLAGIRQTLRRREALVGQLEKYHGAGAEALVEAWAGTWLAPAFAGWDITGLLPRIHCPVLVLQGREDEYGTAEQVRRIEAGVSGPARSRLLDDCGHLPHRERPAAVLEAIEAFLSEFH